MEETELIEVFVHTAASRDSVAVRIANATSGYELVEKMRADHMGIPAGPANLFVEDSEDEIALSRRLSESGVRNHSHVHVHQCRRIETHVSFNGATKTREFSPSATVRKVTRWATEAFGLSPVDAGEHCLQVSQSSDRPDEDAHIGSLVSPPHCLVDFDLVPKKRVEG
jgi:hypothetical protein